MATGDFDALKIRMPWKDAAFRSIPSALIFAMIPGRSSSLLVRISAGVAAWGFAVISMHFLVIGAAGPIGLRIGSVDLAWAQFSDPVLDGARLRVTGPAGMHFHLPQACFRSADFVRYVMQHAPQDHPLVAFLRSGQAGLRS